MENDGAGAKIFGYNPDTGEWLQVQVNENGVLQVG